MRYFTISMAGTGVYKEKGSKFVSFIHPIKSLGMYNNFLKRYRLKYKNACHVCSAYRLYINGQIIENAFDDGEPRGSSGLPILNKLKKHELVNISLYIVRYFGGTKLGISGLISSYGLAAEDSFLNISKKLWKPVKIIDITHNYKYSKLINIACLKFKGEIANQDFNHKIQTRVKIKVDLEFEFKKFLFENSNGEISILL